MLALRGLTFFLSKIVLVFVGSIRVNLSDEIFDAYASDFISSMVSKTFTLDFCFCFGIGKLKN